MTRELTHDELRQDEYDAAMSQHAADLGLEHATGRPRLEHCAAHGHFKPLFLFDSECPACLDEDRERRDRDRQLFDRKFIPQGETNV